MGKDGFLTPKAIANRSKAKGLQKLRWFCQMCQKQCRDANGFKCHKLTEGHQRMMKLFLENESTMLDKFSKDFESAMMSLIRRRWRSKRVYANKVYNEYISDKTHLHMNSTCWQTLGAFVKHLGKSGLCTIDRTEKGWYLKYIDRDPEVLARQAMIEQKEKNGSE
jgi:DNA/RNA-binding protein KIN17